MATDVIVSPITSEQIETMPIDDLREDFASLMARIVSSYGDDEPSQEREGK